MPNAAPRPCTHPGCGRLVRDGTGRCDRHPKPVWQHKPNATKRITGRKLQAMRASLFQREPLCRHCKAEGRFTLATQRDHIVPLAEGGLDDDGNTQGLCDDCHDVKSEAERARGVKRAWAGYREPDR